MAGRDDGEFELILGNKQLLSVLFIVIVLLGVFFAMGFLAGRSTGTGTVAAHKDADQVPISVDAASTRSAEPMPPAPVAEATPQPPARQPDAPPAHQTSVQPPAQGKSEAAKPEAPKPAPPTPPAKPVETPKPTPTAAFAQNPPQGTYLQAAAIRRADAESMLAYIGEKTRLRGFVTPVPNSSDNFRVIVGPLPTNDDMANARVKLAEIGIKTPYPVKY